MSVDETAYLSFRFPVRDIGVEFVDKAFISAGELADGGAVADPGTGLVDAGEPAAGPETGFAVSSVVVMCWRLLVGSCSMSDDRFPRGVRSSLVRLLLNALFQSRARLLTVTSAPAILLSSSLLVKACFVIFTPRYFSLLTFSSLLPSLNLMVTFLFMQIVLHFALFSFIL